LNKTLLNQNLSASSLPGENGLSMGEG